MYDERPTWSTIDDLVEEVAAVQHGLFSRSQAAEAGADRNMFRRRLDARRWRRVAPNVFEFPGTGHTWARKVWIAFLNAGPDSVVSHGAAARLRGLRPIEGYPVDLIVDRSQTRALPDTRRHRLGDLRPEDVETCSGLPVTTPARTIVDLAAIVGPTRLKHLVEYAVVDQRCSVNQVATMLDALRRPGKAGVRALGEVLDLLGPGDGLPRSELERLFDAARIAAGLPEPMHEHPLPNTLGLVGFVDRCWPEAKLIVEVDGRRWHTRRTELARDHDRDLEAARCGYHVLRLVWERLDSDATNTAAALREIYHQRLALLRG